MPRRRADSVEAYIGRNALKTIDDAAGSGMRLGMGPMYDYVASVHPGMSRTMYDSLISAYRQARRAGGMLGPRTSGQVGTVAPLGISQPRRYRYGVRYTSKIGAGEIPERWMNVDSSQALTSTQLLESIEGALAEWRARAVGREEHYKNLMAISLVSLEVRTVTQRGGN